MYYSAAVVEQPSPYGKYVVLPFDKVGLELGLLNVASSIMFLGAPVST